MVASHSHHRDSTSQTSDSSTLHNEEGVPFPSRSRSHCVLGTSLHIFHIYHSAGKARSPRSTLQKVVVMEMV